jgi:hypothetical protein
MKRVNYLRIVIGAPLVVCILLSISIWFLDPEGAGTLYSAAFWFGGILNILTFICACFYIPILVFSWRWLEAAPSRQVNWFVALSPLPCVVICTTILGAHLPAAQMAQLFGFLAAIAGCYIAGSFAVYLLGRRTGWIESAT